MPQQDTADLAVNPTSADGRIYPSLYDNTDTTFGAVALGLLVVFSLQALIVYMYRISKADHAYLTWFATGLVAWVVGIYVADMLIAGPDTELLSKQERIGILDFVKSTCLMVFSYYFGLKAQTPEEKSPT